MKVAPYLEHGIATFPFKYLQKYDFVVHDMSIIDESKKILSKMDEIAIDGDCLRGELRATHLLSTLFDIRSII